jgi:ribose transport system substrate-binding protein
MKKLLIAVLMVAMVATGTFAAAGRSRPRSGVHPPDLQGLPAPVLAGREEGRRECSQGSWSQITFEGPETEAQVDKQIEMIQAALGKNPKALGIAALDSKAAIPLLQQAQAKKIPIIAFDSGVDSDIPLTTVSTDNIVAAGLAADKMAEAIGGKGKVAVLVHDQTSRTGIDRRDGFVKRMKEKYPDIQVLEPQYGGGDHLRSTEIAKASSTATPTSRVTSVPTKAPPSAWSTR